MALVYVGIGFFYKEKIKNLLYSRSIQYDILAIVITIGLSLSLFFVYRIKHTLSFFDMKPVYYKELFFSILISCLFGIIFSRLVYWITNIREFDVVNFFMSLCGCATVPIMFMHVPLNYWKDMLGYGDIAYVVIGVGIPLFISIICNRSGIMRKLFGLPEISFQRKII